MVTKKSFVLNESWQVDLGVGLWFGSSQTKTVPCLVFDVMRALLGDASFQTNEKSVVDASILSTRHELFVFAGDY
jgi:hypothetical protein